MIFNVNKRKRKCQRYQGKSRPHFGARVGSCFYLAHRYPLQLWNFSYWDLNISLRADQWVESNICAYD